MMMLLHFDACEKYLYNFVQLARILTKIVQMRTFDKKNVDYLFGERNN